MLTLAVITFATLAISLVLGFVPGSIITSAIAGGSKSRGPVVLGISIGIGFAVSSIAAAWAFGLFGANNYLAIMITLTVLSLGLLIVPKFRNSLSIWKEFGRWDALLLLLPFIAALYSKPYWSGLKALKITAGGGPDIPQNLMTVLAQPNVGSTWAQGLDNFLAFLGDKNLGEAIYHLYQLPSMQQQAGFDYLIYGTRWGLSIPLAQVLRIDPSFLVAGQGLTISAGIAALGLIIYAFSRLVFERYSLSFLLLLASISATPLMVQVFNGGMAQAWALPGIGLLSSVLLLTLYLKTRDELTPTVFKGLVALSAFGWIANAVTYIDSSMTLAAVFAISAIFLGILAKRELSLALIKTVFIGGLIAAVIVAPYTYAAMTTMSIRLKLASGTGFLFNYWPLPSEMLGLINIWTGKAGEPRDPVVMLIGVLLSAGIVWLVLRGLRSKVAWDRSVSILGLSIIIVCAAVAFWAKNTSLGSNYSYVKVATYVGPLFILIIGERMSQNLKVKRAKNSKNDTPYWLRMVTPVFYVTIMVASVVSANAGLLKQQEFSYPSEMTIILNDEAAQAELSNYNYLTTYRALSNVLGFMGDTHWVGKAPNDILMATRMNNEMRIICFVGDAACAPKTPEITGNVLNKYGMRVFQSPITTAQFAALKPLDRFYADMDAVGQPRFDVPDRFVGGNPLLKPNT
jgi:hypothetical protein